MKYKLLRFYLLGILAMLCGVLSPIWADTGTITFGNSGLKINAASVTGDDNLGNTWTITTASTTSFTQQTDYSQVGSSSKPAKSITFTTTLPESVTITAFSAKFGGFSGTAGDVSLTVGDTEVGSGSLNATSDVTVLSSESAEGTVLTVSVTNIAKGVKCYNISYTYADASDTRTETTLTLGDYLTSGYVGESMDLPTVTVTAGTTDLENPEIEWESSNESVATIGDGVINLLAAGTTTITATYDGDETNYKGSTANFTLTVTKAPYTTIAAMLDDITSTRTNATYQFENLLVTYVQGGNTYVSDGTNGFLFYGSELGLNAGEKITGTAAGQLYTYNGLPEMALSADGIKATVVSEGNEVAWPTITPADLQGNINVPVIIENAVYVGAGSGKNLTFKVVDTEFAVYNNWSIDVTALEADKSYTLTGVGAIYSKSGTTTYQLYLVSFEETAEAPAGFRDIKLDLTQHSELTTGSPVYITVSEDGAIGTTDDASKAAATITASAHGSYGSSNFTASVPVEGCVKITYATHDYGNDITVTNSDGETVATLNTQGGKWMSDHSNVVVAYYRVNEPTTLNFSKANYNPYFAVEAIDEADLPAEVTAYTVAFTTTGVSCEGVTPAELTVEAGSTVTIPANTTLYKEGCTLTAWTDGTNQYTAGDEVTVSEDMTLTPVFTENTVSLADRTEAVTLKWNFRKDQGAPALNYQNKDGLLVTQATVGSSSIDVKMPFTTNNGGKLNNLNNNDCAQCTNNTVFTVPSCKGAVVTMEAYGSSYVFKADGKTPTTIDGQSDYDGGQTLNYTIAGTSETVDIVMGNDAGYVRFVQVVLPVVESQGGGESYDNEVATIEWPMDEPADYSKNTVSPEGVFSTVSVDLGAVKLMDQNGNENATGTSNVSSGVTFSQMRPTNGASDYVTWVAKPAAGLTFTPTKVAAYIVRFGTDAENGITFSAKAGEGNAVTLGNFTAPRNNKSQADDKYGKNANYAVNGFVEIELTDEQQAALTSGDGFSLMGTIGVGNSKAGGIAKVTVTGFVNGTAASVNKYTLATAVAPEEAGSVNVYPVADEYEEGSTIKLTATENFGYDFVNWTDADGVEVSTEPVYTFDISKDETLTANFVAVETYELALTVDGTNDYMVTIDPAPTVVDGKMMYEAGTAVQLTANQYDGLVTFTNWSTGETASSKLISMTEDVTLTAVYEQADILAGWDFYKSGNNGRVADFASADNETAALSLVLTSNGTTTAGWLDKSTEAANGYESFAGAAVNWNKGASNGDVGYYHWQTKLNAEQFTDIKVQFQMLYNYNAYQKYNAEYSLDGETWTNFGSITMTGAKAVASFSESLPSACNNQKDLYIRMIADKTSNVDGTASANDGNALAMFFITGTEALVDDGTAPVLVSTIPADGATGASASGKVVLTFDEKVMVSSDAAATLGSLTLTPTVSGKSISFEYKGLEYSTPYTFTLPVYTVSDLTNNAIDTEITFSFTTMERPTVEKGLYDAVVENVDGLVAAISEADARTDKNVRYRIFLKNGTYQLPQGTADVTHNVELKDGTSQTIVTKEVITYIKSGNISLIGESRDGVVITNTIPADETFEGKYGTASVYEGIGSSDVLQVSGSGLYFQDLTVSTGMEDARGRDIALNDKGTQNTFKNVCLHGYQDTWKSGKGLYYFEGGVIRGRTDFLCGGGDAFFNQVEVVMCEKGGYVVAPQGNNHYGYVFKDCTIKGEASDVSGNYNLGRAWTADAETYFINTTMEALPNAKAWSDWNNGPTRFAEFNSKTAKGTDVDLSQRATTINGTANNPVLTAEEALEIGDLHNSFGEWDPTLLTEQAPVPQNVKQEGNTLVWDGSNYALLWAIVKDGAVVDFTTEPAYELTESGTYAVRAANEMGGLSEASESVEATVTETVKVTLNSAGLATLASSKALDLSSVDGLTAYIVTAAEGSKATLMSVDAAPAETGLVLKGTANAEYSIPVATTAPAAVSGNLLEAAVEATAVDASSVYVLDGDNFKVFTGTEIPAGKAYLPKSSSARLLELVFGDATGIATVDVNAPVEVYDLQGRRVKTAKKGIYVVDGKKVIIK